MRDDVPVSLSSGMVPYERFDAWKMAHQLALQVYKVTDGWPANERYGLLKAQPSAGHAELRRYLDIALGSLSEVSYLLRFTRDRGILDDADYNTLDDLRDQAGKLTWRFYSSLSKTQVL